ncbi:MAG: hypothetical protein WAT39_21870 [Planctomycetota bacterium]
MNASTMWDPDGAGPATPVVVVGGSFSHAGNIESIGCAAWHPATGAWGALSMAGSLAFPTVDELAVTAGGELIAAGVHYPPGPSPVGFVARWSPTGWITVGTADQAVYALAALPNGEVVVGGSFTTVSGTPANQLARWNGTSWSSFGSGPNNVIGDLAVMANGDLVVSGSFTAVAGVQCNSIARWDGVSWSPFGSGMNGPVGALRPLPNGNLVVVGSFTMAGGTVAWGSAVWSGSSWLPAFGYALTGSTTISEIDILPNGDLVLAGTQWTGAWMPVSRAMVFVASGSVLTIVTTGAPETRGNSVTVLPGGDSLIGGSFATLGGAAASHLVRWNGTNWSAVDSGFIGRPGMPVVWCAATLANGGLVVGGEFEHAPSGARNVALWNGTAWSALGTGTNSAVTAVSQAPNGDIVAGGAFTTAGGVAAQRIARWNGTAWAPLSAGINGTVTCMAWLPNGHMVVGGYFSQAGPVITSNVARWDGAWWSALGSGLGGGTAALAVLGNGDLIAGVAGGVARWTGTTWTMVGPPLLWSGQPAAVNALAALPNNTFAAGGRISAAGGMPANAVVRWDGAAWQPYGAGPNPANTVLALAVLPNGDLAAAGGITSGMPGSVQVERWNGANWSAMPGNAMDSVRTLLTLPTAELLVAGGTLQDNGIVSSGLARIGTTCPAAVAAFGTGCSGSGGPNALATTMHPWIGTTFVSSAFGMPALGLAVGVRGLGTATTPLSSILPQGLAGCSLLVTPDLLDLYVPTNGSVVTTIAIPNSLTLAGQTLHQQVVALETSAAGAITALSSTNALTLTIGVF